MAGLLLLVIGLTVGCGRQAVHEPPSASPKEEQLRDSAALLAAGDRAFQSNEYGEARALYEKAVTLAERERATATLVEALAQVARCYSVVGAHENGQPWLNRAASLAKESDPPGWARYRLVLGVYQRDAGDRDLATETFIDLYDYCRKHELHERAVNAAHMVAIAADLETQIIWARKGIEAAEAGGFTHWLGPLWNNLGWTYADLARYEDSLAALIKAREYHYLGGNDRAKLLADWSVGHAHRMVGELRIAREWITDVLERSQMRYDLDPNPDTAQWVGHAAQEFGEIALAEQNYGQARDMLRLAVSRLKEAGMHEWSPQEFQALVDKLEKLRRRK